VFSLNDKDNDIFPCLHNIRLSYNIKNATVLCRSECTFLHKTVNMVVILFTEQVKMLKPVPYPIIGRSSSDFNNFRALLY